jgi:SAM-dependent methyltransferase
MGAYDAIAAEYYRDSHKTCRNFDEVSKAALASFRTRVPPRGLILDVGAGRGRCNEYIGVNARRVVQLDDSPLMLEVEPRESCLLRVLHSAEYLPFADCEFACVTAFLCDAFIGLNCFTEIHRVLQSGGIFIGTIPSYEWGKPLRAELGIELFQTRFITGNGETVVLPSVLVTASQISEMLVVGGFSGDSIEITKHRLPETVKVISSDIQKPADVLGCSVYELDLIYTVFARR